MRLSGILRSWNDDRGFGFIAPTHGGAELFVHISAFPADGSRPVEGESVTYELGRGQNGKPQAVRVTRQAVGVQLTGIRKRPTVVARNRRALPRIVVTVLVITALGAYGYNRFVTSARPLSAPLSSQTNELAPHGPTSFRCDGRTYCSQMTSCAEATYFLKNCPGVKMDGNNDGIPCEQQWCK